MKKTRKAAVAGMFYPSDKQELSNTITKILHNATLEEGLEPKALIVPHAGIIYSGEVAASAYIQLKPQSENIKKVVLIGPSHRVAFEGIALSSKDDWETPLGKVKINSDFNDQLLNIENVITFDEAHKQEHSLEVQLPFLQKVLNEFEIIPLTVGLSNEKTIADIIKIFWEEEDTVIVISTDLSHFHEYELAKKLDDYTIKSIEKNEFEGISGSNACGYMPLNGLLKFCRENELSPILIEANNSGDTAGEKSKVVGYSSWAVPKIKRNKLIAKNYKDEILNIAKESILNGLNLGYPLDASKEKHSKILQQDGACFVTLEINNSLRGCIGSITPTKSLLDDIVTNAYKSAFHDPRFPRLEKNEFEELKISISILSEPTQMSIKSEEDLINKLKQGIDGLIIQDKGYSAVFLPSVWEQLPDKQDFLDALRQKAGMSAKHFSNTFKAYKFSTEYIQSE